MRTREQVEVGEEVRVFNTNRLRKGQPPGGWPGQVVKAGPKLVTITYPHGTVVFRRDTGRSNDAFEYQSYKTIEEATVSARMATVKAALTALGINVMSRCALTVDQLEAMLNAAMTAGTERQ